jgi:hypothetical protein
MNQPFYSFKKKIFGEGGGGGAGKEISENIALCKSVGFLLLHFVIPI